MGKHKDPKDKKDKQKDRRKGHLEKASTADREAAEAETAAQVMEIEERLQQLTIEMKSVENSIRSHAVEAKRAELTTQEVQPLADDATIYRQVGKMFLMQPKTDMQRSLQGMQALRTVESQQLRQARSKLEQKMKSEAEGLKELIGVERMKQFFAGGGTGVGKQGSAGAGLHDLGDKGKDQEVVRPIWGGAAKAATAEALVADPAPAAVEEKAADEIRAN